MVIRPISGAPFVIHCNAITMQVYTSEEWERPFEEREPVFQLTTDECAALEGFFRYWGGSAPAISTRRVRPDVTLNVQYDY